MRNRRNGSPRAILCIALMISLQTTPTLLRAQQPDAIQDWLMTDCEVGQEGRARAELVQVGTQAVPMLITAAQNGPNASFITRRQTDLSAAYDSVQQVLAEGGPDGLDPTDIAAVQVQSRQDFIAQDLNAFVVSYRIRALQGLGVVGGSTAIQTLQQFASDSSSPDLQAVAKETLSGLFSAFSAHLEISGRNRAGFELSARFTLGASSDGINPLTEPVTVQVGTFFMIITPGSFRLNQRDGTFVFEGVINGVNLEIRIKSLGNNAFAFEAEGSGVDLTALTNPVTVALTIGNDQGLTATSLEKE